MTTKSRKKAVAMIAGIVAIIVVVVLCAVCIGWPNAGNSETLMWLSTESAIDSITLSWDERDGIGYYEIFRTDISGTDYGNEDVVPDLKDYELIAEVDGATSSYTDEDVETGHTYGYAVTGFSGLFGFTKEVCTTYEQGSITYETAGPGKPGLLNNGDGENYENSKDCIYLYVESYEGMDPDGVELYRKGSADADFEVIGFTRQDSDKEIKDDTVEPGETYTYRARTFVNQDDRKVHSPYSDEITIPAVNFSAEYSIETISSTDDTFVIRVTSGEYNGETVFDSDMPAKYTVQKDENGAVSVFSAILIAYSNDNDSWQDVPEEGVSIDAGDCIFLKYKLSAYDGYDENADPEAEVFFGGNEAVQSELFMDETDCGGAKYFGSGSGCTIMTLDLVTGEGKAYLDWDY